MTDAALRDKEILKAIFSIESEIGYDAAKEKAQPVIDRINQRDKELTDRLNKKYNLKRKPARHTYGQLKRSKDML